jgi:hypothetical protein
MDPNNRVPDDGFDAGRSRETAGRSGSVQPRPAPLEPAKVSAPVRTVQLVAAEYLVTVNPVDGSEIEPCPPGRRPGIPERRSSGRDAAARRRALPAAGTDAADRPLLEREEERERLIGLLTAGRSVRVTGPSGSGRTALLDSVSPGCEDIAPDGLIRLCGSRRTPTDLLHELFAAVHDAPLRRPGHAGLLEAVRGIGAVIVLDDLEFGGSSLDELLDAAPDCAFLLAATPDIASPSADARVEEVFLAGLPRPACEKLLEQAVDRSLTEDEKGWAADLWFESEGLPLRFVQAAALLRQRDAVRAESEAFDDEGVFSGQSCDVPLDTDGREPPLPPLARTAAPANMLASALGKAARDTLRFAVALGGECPHKGQLPALVADTHADAAVGDLLGCGLLTATGDRYRLAAGVAVQLEAEGYGDDAAERAVTAARHYVWWAGHPSVQPGRVAAESDAILAALAALVTAGGTEEAQEAVSLARTAAPALAAALHWGAWERALRHGQEAARLAGQVADEAYFHHELGVLALCSDNVSRARAELEASIALRGALADRRGAVAGRRALALVRDRTGEFADGPAAVGGGRGDTRAKALMAPSGSALAALHADSGETGKTALISRPGDLSRGTGPGTGAARPAFRRTFLSGLRRNAVGAGAGVVLVAVLGTVLTLGTTSGGEEGGADQVRPEQTSDDSDYGFPDDELSTEGATDRPGPSTSGTSTPSGAPSASDSAGPSGSRSPSPTSSPGRSDPPAEPSTAPSKTTTTPKPSAPSSPSGEPTSSVPPPTGPSPSPTDGSTSAGAVATETPTATYVGASGTDARTAPVI